MKRLLLASFMMAAASLKTLAQTETEPNNSLGQANLVTYPSTTTAYISSGSDNDYFKVRTASAGVLSVAIPVNSIGINLLVTVSDSATSQAINAQNGNPNSNISLVCGGTYYIRVEPGTGTLVPSNPYSLVVGFNATDVCECNNNMANACLVSVNSSTQALMQGYSIMLSGYDKDYYKIRPAKCGTLIVNVPAHPDNISFQVSLIDSAAPVPPIAAPLSGAGTGLTYERAVTAGKTYYLEVKSDNGIYSNNAYTLNLSLDTFDKQECNNNFAAAYQFTKVCDSVIATIRPAADIDYYSFNGNGYADTVIVVNPTPNILTVSFYDATTTMLPGGSYLVAANKTDTMWLTGINTGKYYVKVSQSAGLSSATPYRVILRDTSCSPKPSGVSMVGNHPKASIYPNPNNGSFSIYVPSSNQQMATITITDMVGSVIRTISTATNKQTEIRLNQPLGIYFVIVTVNGVRQVEKVIVSN
jgi:hypothetical protein